VDEIDIGKIRVGQEASVTADAYPNVRFSGKIVRISPEARIEQNVTLFDVIVQVETGGRLNGHERRNRNIGAREKDICWRRLRRERNERRASGR
jgi:hypothetical protein